MRNVHSICWSRKGKQIACGSLNGSIFTYDIEGNQKDEILPPAGFQDEESNRIGRCCILYKYISNNRC